MGLGRVGARVAAARMGACAPRTKEQAVQGSPMVRTRCDARTAQFCGGNTTRFWRWGRGLLSWRGNAGAARRRGDARRAARGPEAARAAIRGAAGCVRGGTLRGCPLARRHKLCDGGGVRCQMQKNKKNIRTVGFEPTPSKRPVPETGALDRSARSARFSPLVCYITLANSPRFICFVRQKNPFSSFSPLRRRVPRLTPPHAWTPTRQGRSRALERSCALFSRGDARDVRELGA